MKRATSDLPESIKDVLRVGSRIKDNDPRTSNRILRIIEIDDTHCRCRHAQYPAFPDTRVRLDRIHCDGKPRRSGFDLVR